VPGPADGGTLSVTGPVEDELGEGEDDDEDEDADDADDALPDDEGKP